MGNRAKNRQNRENEVSKFAHFAKFDVLEKKGRCTRVFLKKNEQFLQMCACTLAKKCAIIM